MKAAGIYITTSTSGESLRAFVPVLPPENWSSFLGAGQISIETVNRLKRFHL